MTVIDLLKGAHQALRAAVPGKRRTAHKVEGPLAASFRQAMIFWDQQKAAGVPLSERVAGLEKTLRACWPFTREWHYLCQRCDDTGIRMQDCPGDLRCGRRHPHLPHEFGASCDCAKGSRFEAPVPAPRDFKAAGKTAKPSEPTRIGR